MSEEFSWDSEVDESSVSTASASASVDFVVLPEGDYQFEVKKVTNKRYQPKPGKTTGITTPCGQKDVGLYVRSPDGSVAFVWESFYEHRSSVFNTINFLRCLGLIPETEKFKGVMPWDKVVGRTGWARFSVDTYNPDKPKNRVKTWYAPSLHADDGLDAEADEAF